MSDSCPCQNCPQVCLHAFDAHSVNRHRNANWSQIDPVHTCFKLHGFDNNVHKWLHITYSTLLPGACIPRSYWLHSIHLKLHYFLLHLYLHLSPHADEFFYFVHALLGSLQRIMCLCLIYWSHVYSQNRINALNWIETTLPDSLAGYWINAHWP